MALPNVKINLQNGALGRVAQTSDGVAGMILAGEQVKSGPGSLVLNEVNYLTSTRELRALGINATDTPFVYKEVSQFFSQAGEGAELYLMVVAENTTFTAMVGTEVDGYDSYLHKLIMAGKGRIRLVGMNKMPSGTAEALTKDSDVVTAMTAAQKTAQEFAGKINPFRVLLPVNDWNGKVDFTPRDQQSNRVAFVLASDKVLSGKYSAAVGQVLGRAASIPVNYSIARVKSGVVALEGWLTNGKTPQENENVLDLLQKAGYIFYRSFPGRNGYYFNDDPMAASYEEDDYSNLNLGRVIDKAITIAYNTFVTEINDSIEVDSDGNIPLPTCKYYEGMIESAVMSRMQYEISSFESFVDPGQNVLTTSTMEVVCKIVPKGVLREIIINLGFENPALKQ